MGPLTIYIYLKYGRPTKPSPETPAKKSCHGGDNTDMAAREKDIESGSEQATMTHSHDHNEQHDTMHAAHDPTISGPESDTQNANKPCHSPSADSRDSPSKADDSVAHCHHHTSRPFLATVLIGVSHCGAGCVLGDLVGEWLVYGTSTTIAGHSIWAELLIDYAFALLFGIVFQYFSIAPMSGEYGPKSVWRAIKADVLSLTSFEIGAFGWMVAYQVGIWGYRLEMNTWTYWWMMQVGMAMGFATAAPVNWFLLTWGIKEPCC
ncbi:hypothetical protein MBLNU457_4562t1 [Dothideomycetes sp. NU457]